MATTMLQTRNKLLRMAASTGLTARVIKAQPKYFGANDYGNLLGEIAC